MCTNRNFHKFVHKSEIDPLVLKWKLRQHKERIWRLLYLYVGWQPSQVVYQKFTWNIKSIHDCRLNNWIKSPIKNSYLAGLRKGTLKEHHEFSMGEPLKTITNGYWFISLKSLLKILDQNCTNHTLFISAGKTFITHLSYNLFEHNLNQSYGILIGFNCIASKEVYVVALNSCHLKTFSYLDYFPFMDMALPSGLWTWLGTSPWSIMHTRSQFLSIDRHCGYLFKLIS